MSAKFLILSGDGINCELETSHAFNHVGIQTDIVHVNDLFLNKSILSGYQGMAIPGGFSFGDELGSGQILALKIKKSLYQEFYRFVDDKKPIIGICNGFQVLTRLGLLPDYKSDRVLSLTHNSHGNFIDQWTKLNTPESTCLWTKGLESIDLPVRHGEGRIVLKNGEEEKVGASLKENGLIALRYSQDINGSFDQIAGLTNKEGTILGLMPHPEAYVFKKLRGNNNEEGYGDGYKLFNNIANYLK